MQPENLDITVRDYISECIKKNETACEERIKELQNTYEKIIKEYTFENLRLREENNLLLYKRFGRSAEQLLADKKQLLLFTEEGKRTKPSEENNLDITEVRSFTRKKAGRKAIDPKLPREERIIDISEEEKTCACGSKMTRIGEETSEKLHIIPPKIIVERIVRPKYACRHCEGTEDEGRSAVHIAPVEPSIIPRSIVSPSLLSTIMIQKYEDHLPFYRQEKQFKRIWVTISRQDMANWQQKAYEKLAPLFKLLKEIIKSGPVIQMDESPLQVMGEEGRSDTQKSYMWLARGGPPGKAVVLYEYRETRAGEHAKKLLEGYSGYLQTDGYEGYDSAIKDMPGIIHAGCFAHVRRRFFEAEKISGQDGAAREGLEYIRKLYHIERELRNEKKETNKTDEEFLTERKSQVLPILNNFKEWLINHGEEIVPPSLLLGKAISYTIKQWDKLVKYLDSPYLTPDNNAAEQAIRPFVVGRKGWLFNKSPDGADSSCGMYTLIETAKQNGLVPWNYLFEVFEKVPYAVSPGDWVKLLPWDEHFHRKN